MKRGIIFDMDGTLWDSAEGVAACWTEVVRHEYPESAGDVTEDEGKNDRVITAEKIQSVMGLTMDKLAEKVFPELEENARMILLDKCCRAENDYLKVHGGRLYPKVEETLQKLTGDYHLYIVSNCQSGYIEAFLSYYGFGKYFDDIECYGNNNLKKGDNIRLVADRNHLDVSVYVGDIQGDYTASVEAGVGFIHAAYGFGEIEEEVPFINSFEELPDVVAGIIEGDYR